MRARQGARWALAVVLSLAVLLAPAIWNGFPLLQWDTGGYLARWYEGYLVPSRSVVYGLILLAGVPLAFWLVLIGQSAITVWVLVLVLRTHGLGKRPFLLLAVIAGLSVVTTLPWLTSILLTDIFCGTGVLALYLLVLRGNTLGRWERRGLMALIAVAVATHSATFAELMALIAAAAAVVIVDRARLRLADLGRGVLAVALGAALVFAADLAVAKRFAWTPGGFALSFGRMLQDGIVKKYLDAHCPDPRLRLCAYKDQLPNDADVWFWGSPLFDKLGRFAGLDDEMQTIALASLRDYPLLQLETAIDDTVQQLLDVRTGEGVIDTIWHTYAIIDRYTPQLVPEMRAARQQHGGISFAVINRLQYPVALIAMALLPVLVLLGIGDVLPAVTLELATTIALAILANAFICGALSNPHDRYGARVVWLAIFAVMLAAAEFVARRSDRPLLAQRELGMQNEVS